ncbi:hypothetical protein F8E02_11090 [Methanoculleus sp. Wushi-C6]|uniref:Transposase n=1 Tax=Methanoculleus caldifontis TaxID=2651577 RepID=A0ABU3X394_9EURY|nr:hypothetical protein [Methanoculleus sp. Wushi-C6]MDV2482534.1 hypothetical protein [Methanoculleus sp. Wushi-C6]
MIEHYNTVRQMIYLMIFMPLPADPEERALRQQSGHQRFYSPTPMRRERRAPQAQTLENTGTALEKTPISRRAIEEKFGIYQDFYPPPPNGY